RRDFLIADQGAKVQVPYLQPAVIIPLYPLLIHHIVPVFFARKTVTRFFIEAFFTIVAITNRVPAQSAPTIVSESFGFIQFSNLFKDCRDLLLVVRSVNASDIKVASPIGFA